MILKARAKINWTLDIVGQRADGYHLMDMLMQPVTLCDTIYIEESEAIDLTTGGTPLLPADEHHLAYRAAVALQKAIGEKRGAKIHVEKAIPVGAGMGGGSADAAAVLVGLNRLWDLNYSQGRLEQIGLTLGADVPFCLRGGLTRTTGIGEVMENLPCKQSWELVMLQPCEGLSTKEVFHGYHAWENIRRPDNEKVARCLAQGDSTGLKGAMANVLEPVSRQMRPTLNQAIHDIEETGAIVAMMTGSGSAVYGVYGEKNRADDAAVVLKKAGYHPLRCRTAQRSVLVEA